MNRKYVISINNVFFSLTMMMPIIYSVLNLFKLSISNQSIFLYLVISIIYMHRVFLTYSKVKKLIIFDCILFFYLLIRGIGTLFDFDFYCYVLYATSFLLFTDKSVLIRFKKYYVNKLRFFYVRVLLLFLVVILSVFISNGLYASFGSTIPVLYGPFDIPHILGYLMIIFYCEASIYESINHSKILLLIKIICIVTCVWTAARSAVLGILIVVFYDYIKIKKPEKKILIFLTFCVVFIAILLINNDIVLNNPLIQKTISAAKAGSISNGRESFVEIAQSTFQYSMNFFEKCFGIGLDSVRNIMYSRIRMRIHIHNDYYNALIGYGCLGLTLFIILQLNVKYVCKNTLGFLLCTVLIFVLAYFNGFAMYSMIVINCQILFLFFDDTTIKTKTELYINRNLK